MYYIYMCVCHSVYYCMCDHFLMYVFVMYYVVMWQLCAYNQSIISFLS